MDGLRECGCKGCRTCLLCENHYGLNNKNPVLNLEKGSYTFCIECNKAWPGWTIDDIKNHPNHTGSPIDFQGIYIQRDFLTEQEELALIQGIDQIPWDLSQSGRRKQNFGPKCNFKKRKLQLGSFKGFPKFSQFVQDKFKDVPILKDFQTIEQCSLEYDPQKGASIDPHIDDCWVWGERILTVNLLSDSILTMTYNTKDKYYNLNCVESYPAVLNEFGNLNADNSCYKLKKEHFQQWPVVRIPMPRRSLLVIYGSARYDWEHRILRDDINERRVCLAYREFTPVYLENGVEFEKGKTILNISSHFF